MIKKNSNTTDIYTTKQDPFALFDSHEIDKYGNYYLTKIPYTKENLAVTANLINPNKLHSSIDGSFEGPRPRNLWRFDLINGKMYILLLSQKKIDFNTIQKKIDPENEDEPCQTVTYDLLKEHINSGDRFKFRLVANPTKKNNGTVYSLKTYKECQNWLFRKANENGFFISKSSLKMSKIENTSFIHKHKNKKAKSNDVFFVSRSFEGVLTVTNEDKIWKALTRGIGREKAFAMGLLTLSPLTA